MLKDKEHHVFHKKIIRKKGADTTHRKIRKSKTKAELANELCSYLKSVQEELKIYNRISMKKDKQEHLKKALASLEQSLSIKPGNVTIRKQYHLCEEELNSFILTGKPFKGYIEIIIKT